MMLNIQEILEVISDKKYVIQRQIHRNSTFKGIKTYKLYLYEIHTDGNNIIYRNSVNKVTSDDEGVWHDMYLKLIKWLYDNK